MKSLLKGLVLKHRFLTLMLMAGYGLLLVYATAQCGNCLLALLGMDKMDGASERFLSSFYVIVLGLPTVTMLWFFRTHDTHEQIQKTKEGTDANVLFGALKMLFDTDPNQHASAKTAAGFALLMELRQQGLQRSTIDLAMCRANLSGLDLTTFLLRGMDLQFAKLRDVNLLNADLTGVNLRRADLSGANLQNTTLQYANLGDATLEETNLRNANLQGADLARADLNGANLMESDLRGADLRWAKYVGNIHRKPHDKKTIFTNALYLDEHQFPKGFDFQGHGMKKVNR